MCRWCRATAGDVVLDLGKQPACDFFPPTDAPGPDPVYPLQMWLCSACGLAQLAADPTTPEEPAGLEPAALVAQAADAVSRVAAAGWLPSGARVIEYGSPHGGSWHGLLADRGLAVATGAELADVVLDCFGMMHAADQAAALAERAWRVGPDGVLLLQYHSVATIIMRGQWNALRHGHFAYYSTPTLVRMLAAVRFAPRTAWTFDLYGGTILLAATRDGSAPPDHTIEALIADEGATGVADPTAFGAVQQGVTDSASALRRWLVRQRADGRRVMGYGAASRAVALLSTAGVGADLLPAVADASPAKQNRRLPGSDIPVITPTELVDARPDAVLVLVSDLVAEVRRALPEIEMVGGAWMDVEDVLSERVDGITHAPEGSLP